MRFGKVLPRAKNMFEMIMDLVKSLGVGSFAIQIDPAAMIPPVREP